MDSALTACWLCFILLLYGGMELWSTKRLVKRHGAYPLAGSPFIAFPRVLLNILFAGKGASIVGGGYTKVTTRPLLDAWSMLTVVKFKGKAFQFIRNDSSLAVLPKCVLDEFANLPATIATPSGGIQIDLLGPYTGVDLNLESRLHQSVVQRKLTPRLGALTPSIESELKAAVADYFPVCDQWTEFMPSQLFGKISARLSGRALVGAALCRDPTWLEISVKYTENVFKTVVLLRLFPKWTHPILYPLLPSYWQAQGYLRSAKAFLGPRIQELIRKSDTGSWNPDENNDDLNVLPWLVDAAKGEDRNPDTIAHAELLLAVASVNTTLLRMVNVLYDLTANRTYFEELRAEVEAQRDSERGWNEKSYSQLYKMDSFLRESQRMTPPMIMGVRRIFKQPHTFANGLHVPKDTYACVATYAIENDPEIVLDPDIFDGLRSYRHRQLNETDHSGSKTFSTDHQFTSPEPDALSFGYGKYACPGRHFAALLIKVLIVKLITEYDFKFLPGTERPKNMMIHEFMFCWPWQKMLLKRKYDRSCPF